MNKKTVFVTGGTGFIGSYILRYLLANGFESITALKRTTSPLELVEDISDKITWIDGDIRDMPLMDEIISNADFVIHVAAVVSFQKSDRDNLMEINVQGTKTIVDACLSNGIEKLIHISSIAALGPEENHELTSEESDWKDTKTKGNYSISKHLAEQEVWRGEAEGLNMAIVNPSIVVGGGFWERGTANIFRKVKDGIPFYAKGGSGIVDVRDVAKMAVRLLNSKHSGLRVIATAENIDLKSFLTKIAHVLEVKPPSIALNGFLNGLFWRAEKVRSWITGKKPIITKESLQNASKLDKYDNSRSKELLSFEYRPIEQTIRETCESLIQSDLHKKSFGILPIHNN